MAESLSGSMMKKVCIIGKNSKVVRSICWGDRFELVSHSELKGLALDNFKAFVVFSWSTHDSVSNLEIHDALVGRKVIFVSTVAVFSVLMRPQWNAYPNEKARFEKIYFRSGASILRLGAFDEKYIGPHVRTSGDRILSSLDELIGSPSQRIITPISVYGDDKIRWLEAASYRLSFFSNNKWWRILLEGAVKLFYRNRQGLYGYTADCFRILSRPIQIGCGAIGGENPNIGELQVFVDPNRDVILRTRGFFDTWLGRRHTGLGKFWHGVRIADGKSGPVKQVPARVKRPQMPFDTVKYRISGIDFEGGTITVATTKIIDPSIRFSKLYLAAGPLINALFLSKGLGVQIKLSDHGICLFCSVPTQDLIGKNLINRKGPIIYGRRVLELDKGRGLIDFRPHVPNDRRLAENFYNEQASNIIKKLLGDFSLLRLNQAFFNKFGIGIYTPRCDGWVQYLQEDCIAVESGKIVSKVINEDLNNISKDVRERFPNMKQQCLPQIYDAQHIFGGGASIPIIRKRLAELERKVVIIGSPSEIHINARHHTYELIKRMKNSCDSKKNKTNS